MVSSVGANNQIASVQTVNNPKVLSGNQAFSEVLATELGSDNNCGYAYTDKYGFSHVVSELKTAREYARDSTGPTGQWTSPGEETYKVFTDPGKVYKYTGPYAGGYALNDSNGRVALPLAGSIDFGNTNKANTDIFKAIDTMLSESRVYMKYIAPLEEEKKKEAK